MSTELEQKDTKEADSKKKQTSRRIKAALIALAVAVGAILIYVWWATQPLDRILSYEVHVSPQENGELFITYRLRWKVLNDSREGPLSWVKIGLANTEHIITAMSDTISHRNRKNSPYAYLYFDRSYYKGEVADFWFTVQQEKMLCDNPDNPGTPFYDFIPGWFDNIEVEHYRFTWDKLPGMTTHNADREDGDILIWEGALKEGESREMIVRYGAQAFPNGLRTRWTPPSHIKDNSVGLNIQPIIVIMIVLFFVQSGIWNWGGSYRHGRGYGHYHGGGRGGGGCACACAGCACACACAGGGRAGCSTKDFYTSPSEKARNADGSNSLSVR